MHGALSLEDLTNEDVMTSTRTNSEVDVSTGMCWYTGNYLVLQHPSVVALNCGICSLQVVVVIFSSS